jgi:hypothetical protein
MLFSDEATLTSGTTVDLFGTQLSITLLATSRRILGLINSGCDTVYTTAEGSNVILQIVSSSLSIADTRFGVGPYITSGPATNDSGQGHIQEIIPMDIPTKGNEVIKLATALTKTNTTGKSNMVQLLYADDIISNPTNGGVAPDWLRSFPVVLPCKDGFETDLVQAATTRTAMTAISVPSWASAIIGGKFANLKSGAITTGQSEQSVIEITGTVPGITPNKWVTNSDGATLGTPVGNGLYHDSIPYVPMYIPLTGRTETITPYVNLVAAVTNGPAVSVSLLWR